MGTDQPMTGNTESLMDSEHRPRPADLPAASLRVLRQALSDAVSYRDPPLYCDECETLAQLCRQCAADLSQARDYLALSRELPDGTQPDFAPSAPDH